MSVTEDGLPNEISAATRARDAIAVRPPAEADRLLERRREIETVERVLDRASAGAGGLVLIHGPAGIGRSELLRATVAAASRRGFSTLLAHGGPFERDYRYAVLRQLVEEPLSRLDEGARRAILLRSGQAAQRALGLLDDDGDEGRPVPPPNYETLHSLDRVIGALAGGRPSILAVDDLQWADQASMGFFSYVAHRSPDRPVVVVGAWRTGEPRARAGPIRMLGADPRTSWLTPGPLGVQSVAAIVAGHTGLELRPEAAEHCRAHTGGVPFLVHAMATHPGLAAPDGAAAVRWADGCAPASVRRSVTSRLAQHRPGVAAIAGAVAVLGDRCSVREAGELAGLPLEEARRSTDALVRADILVHDDGLRFVHPIVRSAVYVELEPADRAARHAAAATMLAPQASAERIAEHLLRAEPAGDVARSEQLRGAARIAADGGAPDRALRISRAPWPKRWIPWIVASRAPSWAGSSSPPVATGQPSNTSTPPSAPREIRTSSSGA
jgi:hypothetical protein